MVIRAAWVFTAALLLLFAVPAAHAAYPGLNGKIAYERNGDIWTMDADGSAQTNITNTPGETELVPAWSPDGKKIAFISSQAVWSMNADGSNRANLTASYTPANPCCFNIHGSGVSWSPDATKIAFTNLNEPCNESIAALATVDPDGTNVQSLHCGPASTSPAFRDSYTPAWSPDGRTVLISAYGGTSDIMAYDIQSATWLALTNTGGQINAFNLGPDWSPSGQRIVFANDIEESFEWFVTVMHRDGTSVTDIAGPQPSRPNPAWSPDGTKIVFAREGDIHTMNPDGGGAAKLTNTLGVTEGSPDWQPIVIGYPRPVAATPLRVPLAVAYSPCVSPNRTHGPPLDSPSCNPPQRVSRLTVGTSDSNGEAAKAIGSVRLAWVGELPIDLTNGDQADVKINVSITDVRNQFDLSDYAAGVGVSAKRRITDRNNTPHPGGPGPATVQDELFSFTVPCIPTADKTVGSTCAISTTADTLVPGTVKERQRAIWQLEGITVLDGGPDANPETSPGNRVFMSQGIFIP